MATFRARSTYLVALNRKKLICLFSNFTFRNSPKDLCFNRETNTRLALPLACHFAVRHTLVHLTVHCNIDACSTWRPLLVGSHYLYQIIWSHATGCLVFACSCGVGGIKTALWGSNTFSVHYNVIIIIVKFRWQLLKGKDTKRHRKSWHLKLYNQFTGNTTLKFNSADNKSRNLTRSLASHLLSSKPISPISD